jgi:hypothetical protein
MNDKKERKKKKKVQVGVTSTPHLLRLKGFPTPSQFVVIMVQLEARYLT